MKWDQDLADTKGLESFVEATFDGIRLYESAGFTQVEPFAVDARDRVLPTAYLGMVVWRPKGADWKQGNKYSWEAEV